MFYLFAETFPWLSAKHFFLFVGVSTSGGVFLLALY